MWPRRQYLELWPHRNYWQHARRCGTNLVKVAACISFLGKIFKNFKAETTLMHDSLNFFKWANISFLMHMNKNARRKRLDTANHNKAVNVSGLRWLHFRIASTYSQMFKQYCGARVPSCNLSKLYAI